MITKASDHTTIKPRVTRKLGDLALWYGMQHSPNYKLLWNNLEKGIFKTLNDWRKFTTGIFASLMTLPLRISHGENQTGIVMTVSGTSTLLALNSTHIWEGFAALGTFFVPLIPFYSDWDQICDYVFTDIHSIPMLCHTIVYFISALFNYLLVLFGKGNTDASKRGDSYITILLNKLFARKRFKIDEYYISIFEVILIASLGYVFWSIFQDYHYAVLLGIVAFSELCQQFNDRSYQKKKGVIIQA